MGENNNKEPITTKIPLSKKFSLAAKEYRNASRASKYRTRKRFNNVAVRIAINIFQLLCIFVLAFSVVFFATNGHILNTLVGSSSKQKLSPVSNSGNNQQNSSNGYTDSSNQSGSDQIDESSSSNSEGNENNDSNNNSSSSTEASGVTELVKKVTDELLDSHGVSDFSKITDPNDLTSKIKQITERDTGKIIITLSSKYKDVTRPEVRDLAKKLLLELNAKFTELTQVTVRTSDNYFVEVANRTS